MQKYFVPNLALVVTFIVTMLIGSCSKVPLTGRQQFSLIPESTLSQMSGQEYQAFLAKNRVISTGNDAQMVKEIGQNVAQAVQAYLTQSKAADRVKGFKWEFNLVESGEVNAWCMPGGKVAVYTGILPVTQDANGLAVVMGHEIAHAVAQHGNERMTQGLLQQLGAIGLTVALQNKPAQTQDLFMQAYGIGSQVGLLLPFSRKQESEADELGLIFSAMAGYDPNQAVPFWERMAKKGGAAPPEFMSTHPSTATRIADLKKFMPTALKYYQKSNKKTNSSTTTTTTPTTTTKPSRGTTPPATATPNTKAQPAKNGSTINKPANNTTGNTPSNNSTNDDINKRGGAKPPRVKTQPK
jgi:predicted Zn-dependent protease